MDLSRHLARSMLSSIFIVGGLDAIQHPDAKSKAAQAVTGPLRKRVPSLGASDRDLVRLNGAVQVGAGALLATSRMRRLASIALIGSIVPTTLAGHRFWEEPEEEGRSAQLVQFAKNAGLLGGLILAAIDNEGAPSLAWRARRKASDVRSDPIGSLPRPLRRLAADVA
jgi:putative oxidoreductase